VLGAHVSDGPGLHRVMWCSARMRMAFMCECVLGLF